MKKCEIFNGSVFRTSRLFNSFDQKGIMITTREKLGGKHQNRNIVGRGMIAVNCEEDEETQIETS